MTDVQAFTRPRDRHIHQPALFFEAVVIVHRVFVWKQTFFETRDEHGIKFQAFAGVHRHQLHSIFTRLRLVVSGFQRSMGQKGCQR